MNTATSGPPTDVGTFLLGAGCQKGGTTWLFHYLKGSPQFVRGYRKEYHVFDTRDLVTEAAMRERIITMAEDAVAAARRGEPVDGQVLHRLSMYANPAFYFEYFAGLLATRPEARLAADMTPDYAMLPARRLGKIRTAFAERGVRAVSVFLMRDPVDRVWSQLRMQAQRQPSRFDGPLEQVLAERHGEPVYALRNQYQETIAALDRSFGEDGAWYGFYEDLFTEDRMREVCDFLRIDFRPPELDERRNASADPVGTLPDHLVRMVAEHYRPTYDGVAARFPDVDLERLWPSARFVR